MLKEIKKKYEHYFLDKTHRFQGEYKEWYKSGHPACHCFYKDDTYHGEYKSWFSDGQKHKHCFYVNGEYEGEYKRWNDDGQLWEHCFYVNGRRHGELKWIYKTEIIEHCFYINGQPFSFDDIPYPATEEERMLFLLKYNIPLLPAETLC